MNKRVIKSFILAVIVLLASSLAGCVNQHNKDCWSETTKKTTTHLMREQLLRYIGSLIKASDINALTDEKKKAIDQSLSLVLSQFIVKTSNTDANSLTCSATVKFTYTKQGGATLNDERMIDFELFEGEVGRVVVINSGPLINMINQSEEK